MTIVGIGLDLIDLAQFSALYGDDDPDVLARCFTVQELLDAGIEADRVSRLAARFAAKEAVFKALGGAQGISHTDIEVVGTATGAPEIRLHGPAAALAQRVGADRVTVSLTHSAASAAAVAIALYAGPR